MRFTKFDQRSAPVEQPKDAEAAALAKANKWAERGEAVAVSLLMPGKAFWIGIKEGLSKTKRVS